MDIVLDNRESHIADLLQEYNPEMAQLSVGDILVLKGNEGVLLERKTSSDFISSIRSNRLWEQLLKMIKKDTVGLYKITRRILVIHGAFDPFIDKAQIFGAFMEILFVYEIPIVTVKSDSEFKEFFRILVQRECRGANKKIPQERWYRKRLSSDPPPRRIRKYTSWHHYRT